MSKDNSSQLFHTYIPLAMNYCWMKHCLRNVSRFTLGLCCCNCSICCMLCFVVPDRPSDVHSVMVLIVKAVGELLRYKFMNGPLYRIN